VDAKIGKILPAHPRAYCKIIFRGEVDTWAVVETRKISALARTRAHAEAWHGQGGRAKKLAEKRERSLRLFAGPRGLSRSTAVGLDWSSERRGGAPHRESCHLLLAHLRLIAFLGSQYHAVGGAGICQSALQESNEFARKQHQRHQPPTTPPKCALQENLPR
jgi:hypothetical protein